MATMPSPQERPDLYDEYDNGPVTPDEKLSAFVKEQIARIGSVQEARKNTEVAGRAEASRNQRL